MADIDRFSFYKEHPRSCAPDDFWGQVMRTVGGRPVDEEQIDWIVDAIVNGLDLQPTDRLLDLCCGNGALTDRVFRFCSGGRGVDFSPALIQVALDNFHAPPERVYLMADIEEFLTEHRFSDCNKALCYGSFMFLEATKAQEALRLLRSLHPEIEKIFIGNLPDRARMDQFFKPGQYTAGIEFDPSSPIGIWRTESEFTAMAAEVGWTTTYSRMRPDFYAAHFRYDAVLTPATAGQ